MIIDEAHERTLQTDFLLGMLKGIQQHRKARPELDGESVSTKNSDCSDGGPGPLRIIVMSATLEVTNIVLKH